MTRRGYQSVFLARFGSRVDDFHSLPEQRQLKDFGRWSGWPRCSCWCGRRCRRCPCSRRGRRLPAPPLNACPDQVRSLDTFSSVHSGLHPLKSVRYEFQNSRKIYSPHKEVHGNKIDTVRNRCGYGKCRMF